jgi:hypothetical protein
MLKKIVKSLDAVPSRFHGLYEKRGDRYYLRSDIDPATGKKKVDEDEDVSDEDTADEDEVDDVDESASKKKSPAESRRLREFRNENIRLRKEMEALKGMLGDLTPEDLENMRAAASRVQDDEEKQLLNKGKFDEVLNRRISSLKAENEKLLKKVNDELKTTKDRSEKLRAQLKRDRIVAKVREAADKLKMRIPQTAIPDVDARALNIFDLDEDGNLIAMDGEDSRLNNEGKEYSPHDFVLSLVEDAPHLVEGATGGDIKDSKGGKVRRGGVITIDSSDPKQFGANLENIASGKVDVRMG